MEKDVRLLRVLAACIGTTIEYPIRQVSLWLQCVDGISYPPPV